ncbi:unnamed protein product, partial [Prorocentrum cordatum]
DGSPLAPSTAPASPWSPVTPMVASASAFFPAAAGASVCSSGRCLPRATASGMEVAPPSPAVSPDVSPAMSPGAAIRRNARRLGIPLDLQVHGIHAPVPVLAGGPDGDEVLAPSPHAGSAPAPVELPKDLPLHRPSTKPPQSITAAARPSAGRFSGA